jgi:hypothetical protein
MIERSDSMNLVTSCHQIESVVLPSPAGKVWEALKSFAWEKYLPTSVKSSKFTSGNEHEVGSIFELEYVDGSVWTYRITDISETRRGLGFELISATPEISFSSMTSFIRIFKVTEDKTTFLQWETDFSNDVNSHTLQDQKYKKLEYFKDLKNLN